MKERLVQLLDLEQITPSKFADVIGVQRSSVSHVISGRNNPSFDFIQKTLTAFPGLNAEWLILGKGTMYEQMGRQGTGTLFDTKSNEIGVDREREEIQLPSDNQELTAEKTMAESAEKEFAGDNEAAEGTGEHGTHQDGSGTEIKDVDPRSATKRITRVLLFYDDDTFTSFDPS